MKISQGLEVFILLLSNGFEEVKLTIQQTDRQWEIARTQGRLPSLQFVYRVWWNQQFRAGIQNEKQFREGKKINTIVYLLSLGCPWNTHMKRSVVRDRECPVSGGRSGMQ